MSLNLDLKGNILLVDGVTSTGAQTFTVNPILATGTTIKSNAASATLTSNAATVTSYFVQGTTPTLSTAGGASQAEVITLTGVAAGDIAFVSLAGGTNTTKNITLQAVCTSNTITVTIYNNTAATALNGTVIFNLMVLKA